MPRSLLLTSLLSLASGTAACSGAGPSPSSAPGTLSARASQPYCEQTEEPLVADADSPMGDPGELLQRVRQVYKRDFVWRSDLGHVHHAAEGQASRLELRLTPKGPVKLFRYQVVYPPTEGPQRLMALICPDYSLALEVSGTLKTPDGLLDERFEGKLLTQHDPMAKRITTDLMLSKRLDALHGTFRIQRREPPELQGEEVSFNFLLEQDGTLGGVMAGTFAHGDWASLERFFCLKDNDCN